MKYNHVLIREILEMWVNQFPQMELPSKHDRIEALWKLIDLKPEQEEGSVDLDNSEVFDRLDELMKKSKQPSN